MFKGYYYDKHNAHSDNNAPPPSTKQNSIVIDSTGNKDGEKEFDFIGEENVVEDSEEEK